MDENNYLKHRTFCKQCHNENKKNNISTMTENEIDTTPQQTKINKINNNVSTFENYACVVNGPRNVGKTYHILKILEKIGEKRPIHIKTRLPNQYPKYKTCTEIKPMNKYKGSVVIFDDMLGAKKSSQIDEFFIRERHEDLGVNYNSQTYFALPRQSIRDNSDRLILFKQTLRDVRIMYQDVGAFDMKYDEFKEICRVAWGEKFNNLCIDRTRKEGKYRIFNASKTAYFECIPESEPF